MVYNYSSGGYGHLVSSLHPPSQTFVTHISPMSSSQLISLGMSISSSSREYDPRPIRTPAPSSHETLRSQCTCQSMCNLYIHVQALPSHLPILIPFHINFASYSIKSWLVLHIHYRLHSSATSSWRNRIINPFFIPSFLARLALGHHSPEFEADKQRCAAEERCEEEGRALA